MLLQKLFRGVTLALAFVLAASAQLFAGGADSVVFQNDSVFTIEGVKEELKTEGEWIKVTKEEIDPQAVADASGGIDPEINTDYVWRPNNVEEGWSPYSNGYWQYTNYGWMWVSYYTWGWRTCHYGRWWWSDRWGWVWSPGFVFAPAWVVWMYNDGYCGWYPISPWVRYHHGYGWRCHNMRYKVRCWTFVEKRRFADPIPPIRPVVDPYIQTEIIKNSLYDVNPKVSVGGVNNNGPGVKNIEEVTGKRQLADDVTMYNNVKKYNGNRSDDDVKIKNDKKIIDDKVGSNNTGVKKNDGGNSTDGTKGNNNTNGNNGTKGDYNTGTKTKDNTGSNNNDGWKKKDDSGNRNNEGSKNNEGNKQYNPPPKKNDPPKQYDPPKQEQPKQEQPKQDPPKKYDPPKQEQPKKESPPPTKKDDGNKGKK